MATPIEVISVVDGGVDVMRSFSRAKVPLLDLSLTLLMTSWIWSGSGVGVGVGLGLGGGGEVGETGRGRTVI